MRSLNKGDIMCEQQSHRSLGVNELTIEMPADHVHMGGHTWLGRQEEEITVGTIPEKCDIGQLGRLC